MAHLGMTPEQELEAFRDWPEAEVCRLLAARIRRARQDQGESQAQFAERAGVPLRTYKRFELTGKATLFNFAQVMRALGRSQYLLLLFPSPGPASVPSLESGLAALRKRIGHTGGGP